MSILVDTGVLYADHDEDATRHEDAATALDTVYDGEYGQPHISEYVYDEAVTLTFQRSSSFDAASAIGKRMRGDDPYPRVFDLFHVSPATFRDSVETFERYEDQGLSFTDAVQVTQANHRNVDGILTFDTDFDGLVERISPESV